MLTLVLYSVVVHVLLAMCLSMGYASNVQLAATCVHMYKTTVPHAQLDIICTPAQTQIQV